MQRLWLKLARPHFFVHRPARIHNEAQNLTSGKHIPFTNMPNMQNLIFVTVQV